MLVELRNTILIPFILPNIFAIAQKLDDKHIFQTEIFPHLTKILLMEEPFQIPLLCLQHLEFMIGQLEPSMVQTSTPCS